MKTWKQSIWSLGILAGLAGSLRAQVPGLPTPSGAGGAALPAAPAIPAVPAVPAAPAGMNIWGFLLPNAGQIASLKACKAKMCQSPLGQMMNGLTQPLTAFSGGLIPSCCPPIPPADLAQPATTADGASARIKAIEAEAGARRQSIRYLGTVDCRYYPEAEDALIAGLRIDPTVCVRLEAALALGRSCCCTKKVIVALTETVTGGQKIGPQERCQEVKDAALVALNHCLTCQTTVVEPQKPPEVPREPVGPPKPVPGEARPADANAANGLGTSSLLPVAFLNELQTVSLQQAVEQARRAVAAQTPQVQSRAVRPALPAEQPDRSVYGILVHASHAYTPNYKSQQPDRPVDAAAPPAQPAQAIKTAPPRSDQAAPIVPAAQNASVAPVLQQSSSSAAFVMPGSIREVETLADGSKAVLDWLKVLPEQDYPPELRVTAAEHLAACDWHKTPQAAQALLTGARKDPDPQVRVACIRGLAQMKVNTRTVRNVLGTLKDTDNPQIREEAQKALQILIAPRFHFWGDG